MKNNTRKINKNPILIALLFLLSCTPSIYMVSVVDRSPSEEPIWMTQQFENEIIGFGEHRNKKIAYNEAITDIQKKIASEIGLEISYASLNTKVESNTEYDETSITNFDIIGDAIIQEIYSRITGTYWEHCRSQTGKKVFNDFYRYHLKAEISPEIISELRDLTIKENNNRLQIFEEYLFKSEQLFLSENPYPVEMLREYVETLNVANSLFYEKTIKSRICLNRINDIVSNFKIAKVTNYSEVRPTRHYLEFRVEYDNKPIDGIKVNFQLRQGRGNISQSSVSDSEGMVKCQVFQIAMSRNNTIVAYLDFADPFDQIDELNSTSARSALKNIDRVLINKSARNNFSSLSQIAKVRAGSLEINRVRYRFVGIFRHINDFDCNFYLKESNGRSVEFTHYDVDITCWYQPLLSSKVLTDSKRGSFGIHPPLKLEYNDKQNFKLPGSEKIAALVNELKSAHEIGMRYLQIDLELFGEDDAGNDMEVYLKTNEMPWYNLFEK